MNRRRRFVRVAVAALLAAAAACGGDSTGTGPQAASVTGIAGDSQTAPTGSVLTFPLSFVALGSNGQPAQGVHVTWSATPSGGASFTPATETTDVNGAASTTATLGSVLGNITIHAAVSGVSDVVYHATALDPCAYLAPYALGDTVIGALKTTDCNFGHSGWYYDFYALDLPVGQQSIRLAMNSATFDTWVDLWSVDGPLFGFDDDVALGTVQNSQLDIILPGGKRPVRHSGEEPPGRRHRGVDVRWLSVDGQGSTGCSYFAWPWGVERERPRIGKAREALVLLAFGAGMCEGQVVGGRPCDP